MTLVHLAQTMYMTGSVALFVSLIPTSPVAGRLLAMFGCAMFFLGTLIQW